MKEGHMTRGETCKQNLLRPTLPQKDLDTLLQLLSENCFGSLHNPPKHECVRGVRRSHLKTFPLVAKAEIIGPRFSRGFWYSPPEPSFDLFGLRLRLCRRGHLTPALHSITVHLISGGGQEQQHLAGAGCQAMKDSFRGQRSTPPQD